MKKVLFLLFTALFFVSCDCPYCGKRKCICNDYGVRYDYDYFYADKLLGEWQICYPCFVGNVELKSVKFFDGYRCDITMSQARSSEWVTETWSYSYNGSYITFSNKFNRNSISFKVNGYIYPELYLQDSFGKYTWRKIKPYSCIK